MRKTAEAVFQMSVECPSAYFSGSTGAGRCKSNL